ncbi:MAG: glycoside hydrolase family 9 protein [Bacteroidota bacterium]
MKTKLFQLVVFFSCIIPLYSQSGSKYIVTDQFGYPPDAVKKAVIRDPQTGYDASESFSPGTSYTVRNAYSGEVVFTGSPATWKSWSTDAASGDRVWHFDFSSLTTPGSYFIQDEQKGERSYTFEISYRAYNEVLKHALRSFFYQRSGFAKEAQYAGAAWADGASHLGPLQDANCRSFFDKNNPATEKDLHGGWYDAGDYNKYTCWTAGYVVDLLLSYRENPSAFGDDYRIPESGNGIPDILDEVKWGLDFLLRMQKWDGSVLSIVGLSHASPPSSATGPSYYGPPNTIATISTAAAFASGAMVYRSIGMGDYADTLLKRAAWAWDWTVQYPDSLFGNNTADYNSQGLGAGQQETDDYGRLMARLRAAAYLFAATGDPGYRDFFDAFYDQCHMLTWNFVFPFETENQETLLFYAGLDDATPAVATQIRSVYKTQVLNGTENLPAMTSLKDPYFAHIKDYTWGSNGIKAGQGNIYMNMLVYGLDPASETKCRNAALTFLNYLHGVNPLSMVYLSNMYAYGGERCVNEFYHSWFTNGSALWDRVGTSTYGPAPGYLTGGPNPSYDWDGCCPSGCGSSTNNAICTSESITPPKGQPKMKSYKDFNTSWPLNSWSVTENSCGYQVRYIRLLSKFVTADIDCNGDIGGTAFPDSCRICSGGNTGREPVLDKALCYDCNNDFNGVAVFDVCGLCSGGWTGRETVTDINDCYDCNGDFNGAAIEDSCGICAGGNTGLEPVLDKAACYDCNGDFLGEAYPDSCGLCAGGNSGREPILERSACYDCNGDFLGEAEPDSCGLCAGGNTGREPVLERSACYDCNGDFLGEAIRDSCGNCAGGLTGITPVLDPDLCSAGVSGDLNRGGLRIYPNPGTGLFRVEVPGGGMQKLLVLDLRGAVIRETGPGENLQELDLSALPKGCYEVLVLCSDRVLREKVILY